MIVNLLIRRYCKNRFIMPKIVKRPSNKKSKPAPRKPRAPQQPVQTRRIPVSATPRPRVPGSGGSMSRLTAAMHICALSDPFCPPARNRKWPDGAGGTTVTMQLRGHLPVVAVSGSNQAYAQFFPALNYQSLVATTYLAGVYTLNSAYTALVISPNTYVGTYRVVTAGIIVRNTLPALTASGYMTVTRFSSTAGPSTSVTAGNEYSAITTTHSVVAGMEVALPFKPLGSAARAFTSLGGSPLTSWDTIAIELTGTGTSSGTVADVEMILNVECTLYPSYEIFQTWVPNTAPSNAVLANAADRVSTALTKSVTSSLENFGKEAEKVSNAVLNDLGPVGKAADLVLKGVESMF